MNATLLNANTPIWGPDRPETSGPFQEAWHIKINDPIGQKALWIRLGILVSRNGFRRIAETWALQFQRNPQRETSWVAVRQTHEIRSFSWVPGDQGPTIRIGECEFGPNHTRGSITSKGQTLSWDLTFASRDDSTYDLISAPMKKVARIPNSHMTAHSDIVFSGTTRVNEEEVIWKDAPGVQIHQSGPGNPLSWTWGHCNSFINEQGRDVPFVFEGLTARMAWFGAISSPPISSFHFRYEGTSHFFNSLSDLLHLRSSPSMTEWRFQADRGELSFRGLAKLEHKDFAGINYEDTDGALIYDASSRLSDLKIHVYRRGKIEMTLLGQGTLSVDLASRKKNPYVPATF